MNNLKPCPFCITSNNTHSDNCYFTLVSRVRQYERQYSYTRGMVKPTAEEIDAAWNNRPVEDLLMIENFRAGYRYANKENIPSTEEMEEINKAYK